MDRRHFLTALPALAFAPRLAAQSAPASLKVRGLSQLTLTVSDVSRSLKFYQDLFGMPVQARQGTTLFLRIGSGPQFLALKQAAPGERPSISAFGMGVENFSVDRVVRVLGDHGVINHAGAPYASQIQVPLVISGPAIAPRRITTSAPSRIRATLRCWSGSRSVAPSRAASRRTTCRIRR